MKKFLSIISGLVFSLTAHADLYDIDGISIEAELTSAKEARPIAIANGQIDAFWVLMQKMISTEDLQRVPFLEQDAISNLVQNVSLTNEKTTATRYRATLGVRFYPERVQAFLTEAQIPFLQRSLPPTLIIPIFQKNEDYLLLTDTNPVYSYFKEFPLSSIDETPVPVGDLEEIALTQSAWERQDYPAFLSLAEKYNAQRVLFFILHQHGPYITVTTKTFSKEDIEPIESVFEYTEPLGNLNNLMPTIVKNVWEKQKSDWRATHTNDLQKPLIYWIRVPITQLTEWNAIQNKLNKSDFSKNFEVRAFRKNEVFLVIHYKGTSEALARAIHKLGLQLTLSNIDGLWDLTIKTGETP